MKLNISIVKHYNYLSSKKTLYGGTKVVKMISKDKSLSHVHGNKIVCHYTGSV